MTNRLVAEEIKKSNETMTAAQTIIAAYNIVKSDIQFEFWQDLEKDLTEKYSYDSLNCENKFDKERVEKFNSNGNNKRNYGILFPIDIPLKTQSTQLICI